MTDVDTGPKPTVESLGAVGDETGDVSAVVTNDVNEERQRDVRSSSPKGRKSPEEEDNSAAMNATSREVQDATEHDTEQVSGVKPPDQLAVNEVTGGPAGDSQTASAAARTDATGGVQVGDSARQNEEGRDGAAEESARPATEGDGEAPENDRQAGEGPPVTPAFTDDEDEGEGKGRQEPPGSEGLQSQELAEAVDPNSAQSPALTSTAAAQLAKRLTNTPADANLPKSQTAHLPAIARGQVRGQQMTSAIADAVRSEALPAPRQPIRTRRPPKYIRLATVTVSPARTRPVPHGPSLYYEEPRRPKKVITWDEANNARPPLRIDMEGPTPCSYTPRVKPLNETNAPSYTFGSKCQPEKNGGSRTSWSKTWFQTPHVWHNKVDFTREGLWPSPNHYPKQSSLGPRQRTMPEAPSYTFGHKSAYSITKPGASKEPSPNEYQRQLADKIVFPRGPAFTHQLRREGTLLWGSGEHTPGPAAYSPSKPSIERPSFTIQGIRREKSHVLGPYSAL